MASFPPPQEHRRKSPRYRRKSPRYPDSTFRTNAVHATDPLTDFDEDWFWTFSEVLREVEEKKKFTENSNLDEFLLKQCLEVEKAWKTLTRSNKRHFLKQLIFYTTPKQLGSKLNPQSIQIILLLRKYIQEIESIPHPSKTNDSPRPSQRAKKTQDLQLEEIQNRALKRQQKRQQSTSFERRRAEIQKETQIKRFRYEQEQIRRQQSINRSRLQQYQERRRKEHQILTHERVVDALAQRNQLMRLKKHQEANKSFLEKRRARMERKKRRETQKGTKAAEKAKRKGADKKPKEEAPPDE